MLTERYKPNPQKSTEELLYSPFDNPTPVLDIGEQLLAMKASGVVRMIVERDEDMYAMRKVLKVYMQ